MAVKSYLDPQKILDFGVSCSQKWEKGRNIVNSDTDSQVFPAHQKEAQQQSKLSPDFKFPGVVRGAVSGNGSGEEEPHSVSAGSYTPPFTICPIQSFKPNKHLPYSLFLNFLIQDLINFFCPIPSFLFQVLIAGELSVRNIKKTKDIRSQCLTARNVAVIIQSLEMEVCYSNTDQMDQVNLLQFL